MIIVDTSVLINLFKGLATPATTKLKELEHSGALIVIPAICCQELLQGAKDEKEWALLNHYLASQELLYPKSEYKTYEFAAKLFYDLRKKGITVRSTIDCLIAQQVIETKHGKLLHDDKDFMFIAKNTSLQCF